MPWTDTSGFCRSRTESPERRQFIIPNASTVSDLLEEYMSIYGVNTWAMSTYEARRSLIFNYINPLIGDMKLEDVTPRTMDKYYQSLFVIQHPSYSRLFLYQSN